MSGALLPQIDKSFCSRFRVVPMLTDGGHVRVYHDGSSNLSMLDHLKVLSATRVEPACVPPKEIERLMGEYFPANVGDPLKSVDKTRDKPKSSDPASGVISLINGWIEEAISLSASDIHVEPHEDQLSVRYRVDGVLQTRQTVPSEYVAEILSRLKIMGGVDIAEKRRPQDGRIRYVLNSRTVDIRLSIIPTDFGEKAVLRILDKETLRLELDRLGFSPDQAATFREAISLPNGIVLVTGPTGSGKTTTLYAALNYLKSPDVNISTIEDPIEYSLEGINQTQVKPEIGLTFAAMLRSLLRQDPDIIMVGEIRDRETLEIAIRASLTGHLVLSTIHTNGAIATIPRLLDMGAEPFLLASALKLVVAQRLVRVNCPDCAQTTVGEDQRLAAMKLGVETKSIRVSLGCSHCRQTGFIGRTAILECLSVTDPIKAVLSTNGSEQSILQSALSEGFVPMKEVARKLVVDGNTTPIEAYQELSS